jgi:hypothetical protein
MCDGFAIGGLEEVACYINEESMLLKSMGGLGIGEKSRS